MMMPIMMVVVNYTGHFNRRLTTIPITKPDNWSYRCYLSVLDVVQVS